MENKAIPIKPEVPLEIINAVNDGTLAIFVGAGASRIVGCMGWDELAINLVNKCYTISNDGKPFIDEKQKDFLLDEIKVKNHKKVITICYEIMEKEHKKEFYYELDKSLKPNENLLKSFNIYDEINKLRGLFITTNADLIFDRIYDGRTLYNDNDFSKLNIDKYKQTILYHIHGSTIDRDSLIFTIPKYIERYNNPAFREFLETIFEKYTILFIGYGVSEFELLDFLVTKFNKGKMGVPRHFALCGYKENEGYKLELDKYFYHSLGINPIAFRKIDGSYNQLYEVVKKWNIDINETSNYLYKTRDKLEIAANNYSNCDFYSNIDPGDILQLIKNDRYQRDYFFRKLGESNNPSPWLKLLNEKGYFNPSNNPDLKPEYSYWNIFGFLENVSLQNKSYPCDDITSILLNIVDSLITPTIETKTLPYSYWINHSLLKIICNMPEDKISLKHIEFINSLIKSNTIGSPISMDIEVTAVPTMISSANEKLFLKLIETILSYKRDENSLFKYVPYIEEYWLNRIMKKYTPIIAKLYNIKALDITLSKIQEIADADRLQLSYGAIPAIESSSQNSAVPDIFVRQLVFFARDMLEQSNPELIKDKTKELLENQHPIFKRIAIHCINYHYNYLNDLFWNWDGNPLENEEFIHEVYELLRVNCHSFSKEQIKRIVQWVELIKLRGYEKTDVSYENSILAYRRKEWLSAIMNTQDEDVLKLYQKYDKINQTIIDHPGFPYWSEGAVFVDNISPISKEELSIMSNEDIANYLINYKDTRDHWDPTGPSVGGLIDVFQIQVAENPNRFVSDLKPFLCVKKVYQCELLRGFNDALKSKRDFHGEAILDYIISLIEPDIFWDEFPLEKDCWSKESLIKEIAWFIINGSYANKFFNTGSTIKIEKILVILSDKSKSNLLHDNNLLISAINSTRGMIFYSMFIYSTLYAKICDNKELKWPNRILDEIDKQFDDERSIEFSVMLGFCLNDIYCYLDKKWVIDNINYIMPAKNINHWKAAFTGYLYSKKLYPDVYILLKDNGHYYRAIHTDFEETDINDRISHHICEFYKHGIEKLDNGSLMMELINNGNLKHIFYIIHYFSRSKNDIKDMGIDIKPLWNILIEKCSEMETKDDIEYKKCISQLSLWINGVDTLDEQISDWLKQSIKNMDDMTANNPNFIDGLLYHVSKTPKIVGEIYIYMLKNNLYPIYSMDEIQKLVQELSNKGERSLALNICNICGMAGFDSFKLEFEKITNCK